MWVSRGRGGEERKQVEGRLLPTFKSDKHFHVVVVVLVRVFFLLFVLGGLVRGVAFGWCDKAAGGNLISFSVLFFFVFFPVFPKSQGTKA